MLISSRPIAEGRGCPNSLTHLTLSRRSRFVKTPAAAASTGHDLTTRSLSRSLRSGKCAISICSKQLHPPGVVVFAQDHPFNNSHSTSSRRRRCREIRLLDTPPERAGVASWGLAQPPRDDRLTSHLGSVAIFLVRGHEDGEPSATLPFTS